MRSAEEILHETYSKYKITNWIDESIIVGIDAINTARKEAIETCAKVVDKSSILKLIDELK